MMKWGAIGAIAVIAALIVLYEWPKFDPDQKKEKAAFAAVLAGACGLRLLLTFFPDMWGPTELLDSIFKPLSKLLE